MLGRVSEWCHDTLAQMVYMCVLLAASSLVMMLDYPLLCPWMMLEHAEEL